MRYQQARSYHLQIIDQAVATSCDEHGGYTYDEGRRSPRYYGFAECDECERKGTMGLYAVPKGKQS